MMMLMMMVNPLDVNNNKFIFFAMFVRQLFLRMVKRPITTVVEGPVLISPIQRRPDGGIRFQLHVKPGAKRSRVTDIGEQSIGVQVGDRRWTIDNLR
jgi:hypothetical protein